MSPAIGSKRKKRKNKRGRVKVEEREGRGKREYDRKVDNEKVIAVMERIIRSLRPSQIKRGTYSSAREWITKK